MTRTGSKLGGDDDGKNKVVPCASVTHCAFLALGFDTSAPLRSTCAKPFSAKSEGRERKREGWGGGRSISIHDCRIHITRFAQVSRRAKTSDL